MDLTILVTAPYRFEATCPPSTYRQLTHAWEATSKALDGAYDVRLTIIEASAHETHGELLERLAATELVLERGLVVVSEIDFMPHTDGLAAALHDCTTFGHDIVAEGGITSKDGFAPDPSTTGPWFLAYRAFPHLPKAQPEWFRAAGPRHDAANLWDSLARDAGREVKMLRAGLPLEAAKWAAAYTVGAHLFFAASYHKASRDLCMPGIRVGDVLGAIEELSYGW